jgi:hypothetical protein
MVFNVLLILCDVDRLFFFDFLALNFNFQRISFFFIGNFEMQMAKGLLWSKT